MAVPRLRNYQDRDVGNLRRAFAGSRRVLYVSPTGSGKTTAFAFMAQSAVAKGLSVAVYA
ncbi:MAG: DEAD/DEAH box helicase family protein, partial [Geminicoccaceae bacterium]